MAGESLKEEVEKQWEKYASKRHFENEEAYVIAKNAFISGVYFGAEHMSEKYDILFQFTLDIINKSL